LQWSRGWSRGWLVGLVASVVALTLVGAGCSRESPEAAFKTFRTALSQGNTATVSAMLGESTRAVLDEAAASYALLGLTEPSHSVALVHAVWVPDEPDVEHIRRVAEDAEQVTLEVTTYGGHASRVVMLRSDDGWRVELDLASVSQALQSHAVEGQ